MFDAQARVNGFRKGELAEKLAVRFGADADDATDMDIQATFENQISVDDRVEITVVLDVVDVAVDVVVLPARGQRKEMTVVVALAHRATTHQSLFESTQTGVLIKSGRRIFSAEQ